MKKITAFIWTYNEEKRLPITLKSLNGFDEIVILDKSSSDKTAQIGESYGAKVYKLPYFDGIRDEIATPIMMQIFNSFRNEYAFEVTCSDVYHPQLYDSMINVINSGDYNAVEIPLYRYSMGFVSKYSCYGDITYQRKLFKVDAFDWSISDLHSDPLRNADKVTRLMPEDKRVAIYHLTHENLDMVLERHLRYAKIEAEDAQKQHDREFNLNRSWRSVLAMVKRYIKLRTYKLGERGHAQLCMLLLYRCAHYLNLYFDEKTEAEIHQIYEDIRAGKNW